MSRERRAAAVAAFAASTVALFLLSRGKWSDALVDSGREWIVPDALSRGDLLYRDVVYWFGPFTPYAHALFFRVFGSSFATLVLAGLAASAGIVGALFFALRRVTRTEEAALWSALAVPSLLFMPGAGGAILGMGYRIWHAAAFSLLAMAAAVKRPDPGEGRRLVAAGALAGLAGLCRTEWGLATVLALLVALGRASDSPRTFLGRALRALGAFVLVFGGVMGFFAARAGARAILEDAPVFLFHLPPETRESVVFAGVRAWRSGAFQMVYGAALWLGVFLLIEVVALRRADPARVRRLWPLLLGVLLVLGVSALAGGAAPGIFLAGAPLACAAGCAVGLSRRAGSLGPPLAGFGALGLLLSYRRPFFIADGPYVAPPLLFALVCAAGLWRLAFEREKREGVRRRLEAGLLAGLSLLIGAAFASRALQYFSDERIPIAGTGGVLSARPELSTEVSALADTIRRESKDDRGLVVFPEGEILNFLSGRRNPLRHKLYLPGYLTEDNEGSVIEELEKSRPAAVVVWRRPAGEYGRGLFGVDYGRRLYGWIEAHYRLMPFASPGQPALLHPRFVLGLRKDRGWEAARNALP